MESHLMTCSQTPNPVVLERYLRLEAGQRELRIYVEMRPWRLRLVNTDWDNKMSVDKYRLMASILGPTFGFCIQIGIRETKKVIQTR